MITLITGGSGSGKSALAEEIAMKLPLPHIYIATMKPFGEETQLKIQRHREMREKKQFSTIECYGELGNVNVPEGATVLLECMSNLTANLMFSDEKYSNQELVNAVLCGVKALAQKAKYLIIISNEVFSDGIEYDYETAEYSAALGKINNELAKISDNVIEAVYGIPVLHKGELF